MEIRSIVLDNGVRVRVGKNKVELQNGGAFLEFTVSPADDSTAKQPKFVVAISRQFQPDGSDDYQFDTPIKMDL